VASETSTDGRRGVDPLELCSWGEISGEWRVSILNTLFVSVHGWRVGVLK